MVGGSGLLQAAGSRAGGEGQPTLGSGSRIPLVATGGAFYLDAEHWFRCRAPFDDISDVPRQTEADAVPDQVLQETIRESRVPKPAKAPTAAERE